MCQKEKYLYQGMRPSVSQSSTVSLSLPNGDGFTDCGECGPASCWPETMGRKEPVPGASTSTPSGPVTIFGAGNGEDRCLILTAGG